jgi:hypothetical protein
MLPVDLSFLRTFRRGPARRGRLIASGALSQMTARETRKIRAVLDSDS